MGRVVLLNYSKKNKKFQYANMVVGGPHYVKETISKELVSKLPPRFKIGYSVGVHMFVGKRKTHYIITRVA